MLLTLIIIVFLLDNYVNICSSSPDLNNGGYSLKHGVKEVLHNYFSLTLPMNELRMLGVAIGYLLRFTACSIPVQKI